MIDMSHSKWVLREFEDVRPVVNQVYMSLLVDVVVRRGSCALMWSRSNIVACKGGLV